MAFATLLTLLDDVASMLDDVALMTKMAAKKTQADGFNHVNRSKNRELPTGFRRWIPEKRKFRMTSIREKVKH